MPIDGSFRRTILALGFVPLALALALSAAGQTSETAISPSANDLVRRAVDNELASSNSKLRYTYRVRKQTPNGSSVKQVADTNDGQVSYLLMMNDQPLTEEQRRIEDEKNQKILNNPEEQRTERGAEHPDPDRWECRCCDSDHQEGDSPDGREQEYLQCVARFHISTVAADIHRV